MLWSNRWGLLLLVLAWSFAVVFMHEISGFHWLVVPVLPVTLVGIAVSLYVGFKSVSAYNRWWEARQAVDTVFDGKRKRGPATRFPAGLIAGVRMLEREPALKPAR